jgi:hypothetical protein
MFDLPVLNASFRALQFGEARIGHVGCTRRLVHAADAIIQHPGGTLTQKFHKPALSMPLPRGQPPRGSLTRPSSSPIAALPSASLAPPPTPSC